MAAWHRKRCAVSPLAAFVFLAAAMVIAAALIVTAGRGSVPADGESGPVRAPARVTNVALDLLSGG